VAFIRHLMNAKVRNTWKVGFNGEIPYSSPPVSLAKRLSKARHEILNFFLFQMTFSVFEGLNPKMSKNQSEGHRATHQLKA